MAFLGGSITFNPGWRQKVCAYLRAQFPETKFKFIIAGIPSLGSLPHAFRLQRDVLDSGKVDLLFIEAAVNDRVNKTDSLTQIRDLEGIVRHAKGSNPAMDIVLMEFADPNKTHDYNIGIIPAEIANHELIAEHYQLPSINLAKEIYDKLLAHEFNWQDDFKDLHPAPFGQELYFVSIRSLLEDCFKEKAQGSNKIYSLPHQLNTYSFTNGSYYDIKNAEHVAGWRIDKHWKPVDNVGTRDGFVDIPVLSAEEPGASLILPFSGNAIGIAVLSGPDAGTIIYSIDGAETKHTDLYTEWSNWLHLPWYVLLGNGLKPGDHRLKITIDNSKNKDSKGNACRIVYFFKNN
ncbi:SGNH/GDSL hydrolase family protein [Mucilaginibacter jinjuensis]|uniref:SGNH/GDSL hydrolase family protein n=1 Tax=Mucilaginibacter jinjuensis TaxID=1176721 RepID=A0ABY7TES2_9SPHI|nr:SGNH/GDSL hydrolase family protein [Mucilaginibacter jinjuensis]WCT14882.1 SGNH/GDSL hydrolase family protein [Mucilaginibacter jinjuensis]